MKSLSRSPRLRPEGHAPRPFLSLVKARTVLASPSRSSLIARKRFHAPERRRVIVRARQLGTHGARQTARHLGYLRRDGVLPDGSPGVLYGTDGADADAEEFRDRARNDPGQVRIMFSPEDVSELVDLRYFTRSVMGDLAGHLERPLDWVAADHFNTGRPHTHVVLRGADVEDRPFFLDRPTLMHGLRERACDILTRHLGPDVDRSLRERLREEADQQRVTGLDLGIREKIRDGLFDARANPDSPEKRLQRSRRIDRLRTLSRMGLAREEEPLRWRVAPAFLPTLRGMAERERSFRIIDRALREVGIDRSLADRCVFAAREGAARSTGALVDWGMRDGVRDTPYVVVDGIDGRVRYADVREFPRSPVRGAIVTLALVSPGLREIDSRTARTARVSLLDAASLQEQIRAGRSTWLDNWPHTGTRDAIRARGFGKDVLQATEARRSWQLERGGPDRELAG